MEGLSSRIHRVTLDVLDNDSVNEAINSIIEKERRIDILVNNAGSKSIGHIRRVKDSVYLTERMIYVRRNLGSSSPGS
jgi:NADP-dependent 3-hydroxy acid dehydrogenase YdfG